MRACAKPVPARMPTIYINHGGGPLPLLGSQPKVAAFLSSYIATLPARPSAVIVATAHWEADPVAVSSGSNPHLLFDYSGFPSESYEYKYSAPGSPPLAKRIRDLLEAAGVAAVADEKRGNDHGVFVPMKLLMPEADVPVIALSLRAGQRAADQVAIGRALAPLRDEGGYIYIYSIYIYTHTHAYIYMYIYTYIDIDIDIDT